MGLPTWTWAYFNPLFVLCVSWGSPAPDGLRQWRSLQQDSDHHFGQWNCYNWVSTLDPQVAAIYFSTLTLSFFSSGYFLKLGQTGDLGLRGELRGMWGRTMALQQLVPSHSKQTRWAGKGPEHLENWGLQIQTYSHNTAFSSWMVLQATKVKKWDFYVLKTVW